MNTDTLTVNGTLFVNGANGTLTATNGNIAANGAVSISAVPLQPRVAAKYLLLAETLATAAVHLRIPAVLVTLNGHNQTVTGTTTFYNFNKTVSSGGPYTLTFDASAWCLYKLLPVI